MKNKTFISSVAASFAAALATQQGWSAVIVGITAGLITQFILWLSEIILFYGKHILQKGIQMDKSI